MFDNDSTRSRRRSSKSSAPRGKKNEIKLVLFPAFNECGAITVMYTNHANETRLRSIRPVNLYWGSNEWHSEPQWLIDVMDIEIEQLRTFALKDIRPI